MGELFTSFDDAWSSFLSRSKPLEGFFEQFPEAGDAVLEGWIVEPPSHVKLAVGSIQDYLAHLPWLVPVPDHFLHVWIGRRDVIGDAWKGWRDLEVFRAAYERVNCFPTAVVVEVEGPIRCLVAGTPNEVPEFLPHLTIALVDTPHPPGELRELLIPLRDSLLGEQVVRNARLVRFPAARSTLLQPWTVEELVSLR